MMEGIQMNIQVVKGTTINTKAESSIERKKMINEIAPNAVPEKRKVEKNEDVSKEQLDKVLEEANNKLKNSKANIRCEYSYNEKLQRVNIKVVDCDTDDVVQEIPSEDLVNTLEKLREMTGLIIDKKL